MKITAIQPETKIYTLKAKDDDKDAALVFDIETSTCIDFLSITINCNDQFVVYPDGNIIVKELSQNIMATTLNVSVQDKSHKLERKDYGNYQKLSPLSFILFSSSRNNHPTSEAKT